MIDRPVEQPTGGRIDARAEPGDATVGNVGGPVLLYDGVCGFCNGSVQFILRHEVRHTLRFAPLQSGFAAVMKRGHPELDEVDSLVWVEGAPSREQVAIRSAAAFKVADYLGGFWKLLLVFKIVPSFIRDFFYDIFARHRYRWFGKYQSCPIPSADTRSRFLD
jgi:predicted DCC family thiol-disulfide oxidoreductase YuxK